MAIGAAISFLVIDYGRLQLERFRVSAENERALLNAYLLASDTQNPDLWLRKLELIQTLSIDPALKDWAGREITYVKNCSAKAVIYQETLRVAASLLDPQTEPTERAAAQRRFEQLYWADLPYVHEGPGVAGAMVHFREAFVAAGSSPAADGLTALNVAMINLGKALSDDDPKKDPACGRGPKG
ncbi:MAG: hypothetical protein ACOH2H_09055 [Cypionkella sp.]